MSYLFTISPDFNANQLSTWYIFNNRLQKFIGDASRLELYDDFQSLRQVLESGKVDIIFANAFDTAFLVREKGYVPVARGTQRSDEALVAVGHNSPVHKVEDFKPGLKVASTDAPDVEMIGRILLEPADLNRENVTIQACSNYVTVAKSLINQDAGAGFFLKRSYDELSDLIRKQLRPIVSSHIYVVSHAMLLAPSLADKRDGLLQGLLKMKSDPADLELLKELGMPMGWQGMDHEEAEFMIDMMDTLLP